jgi:hypothetical protein
MADTGDRRKLGGSCPSRERFKKKASTIISIPAVSTTHPPFTHSRQNVMGDLNKSTSTNEEEIKVMSMRRTAPNEMAT